MSGGLAFRGWAKAELLTVLVLVTKLERESIEQHGVPKTLKMKKLGWQCRVNVEKGEGRRGLFVDSVAPIGTDGKRFCERTQTEFVKISIGSHGQFNLLYFGIWGERLCGSERR